MASDNHISALISLESIQAIRDRNDKMFYQLSQCNRMLGELKDSLEELAQLVAIAARGTPLQARFEAEDGTSPLYAQDKKQLKKRTIEFFKKYPNFPVHRYMTVHKIKLVHESTIREWLKAAGMYDQLRNDKRRANRGTQKTLDKIQEYKEKLDALNEEKIESPVLTAWKESQKK